MPRPKNQRCENCTYFLDGECHRHSPMWPSVCGNGWCGDWLINWDFKVEKEAIEISGPTEGSALCVPEGSISPVLIKNEKEGK